MKIHVLYFLAISILSVLSACKGTSAILYGLKEPKVETEESQSIFLTKVNASVELNLVPKFETLSSIIVAGIAPTSVYVFDSKGNNITLPGAANKCALEPALFIKSLIPSGNYSFNTDYNLDSLDNWFYPLQNKNSHFIKSVNTDFYAFITWAIWPGEKVFKRDIQSCIEAVKTNEKAKIQLVLLNLDKQAAWGEENLKKVKFTKQSISVLY